MTFPTFRLDNQVAIITGGGQGIGRSIALGFANAGATVVVTGRRLEPLQEVERELAAAGRPGLAMRMDVGNPDDVSRAFDQVKATYKRLDVLVNNAGVRVNKPVLEHTLEDWESVFRVNSTGAFLCCQAAARIMREQGSGCIINVSSHMAFMTGADRVAYCASKAAMVQMTRVMAIDWARYGIRVCCLGPGFTKTPFTMARLEAGTLPSSPDKIPMGRMAEPDEMIGAAIFLASDAGSFVNGEFLVVDGGQWVYWR